MLESQILMLGNLELFFEDKDVSLIEHVIQRVEFLNEFDFFCLGELLQSYIFELNVISFLESPRVCH